MSCQFSSPLPFLSAPSGGQWAESGPRAGAGPHRQPGAGRGRGWRGAGPLLSSPLQAGRGRPGAMEPEGKRRAEGAAGRAGPGLRGRAGETAGGAGEARARGLRDPPSAQPGRSGARGGRRSPPAAGFPRAPSPFHRTGSRSRSRRGCAHPAGERGQARGRTARGSVCGSFRRPGDGPGRRAGKGRLGPGSPPKARVPGELLLEFKVIQDGRAAAPGALASVAKMMENLPPIGRPCREPRAPLPWPLQGPAGRRFPPGAAGL